MCENKKRIDFDYIVGDKVLILKDGILCKSESPKQKNMDYNTSSYKWNNQGYTQNQIGTIKCPESITVLQKRQVKNSNNKKVKKNKKNLLSPLSKTLMLVCSNRKLPAHKICSYIYIFF